MGQSSEELRRDIEQTREDLGSDLDAIGDRVSPGRIMERRRNRMRDSVASARERIFGSDAGSTDLMEQGSSGMGDRARQQAQGNPLMAGLVAFGAGFAAAAAFPGTATEGQVAAKVKEKAQPLTDEATKVGHEVASTLQESGQQAAQELKETANRGAEQVKETAKTSAADTKQAGTDAAAQVKDEAKSSGS